MIFFRERAYVPSQLLARAGRLMLERTCTTHPWIVKINEFEEAA